MWQGVTEWVKRFSVKNLCQYKKDLALLIVRKIIVTRPDSLVSTTIACSSLSVSKLLPNMLKCCRYLQNKMELRVLKTDQDSGKL